MEGQSFQFDQTMVRAFLLGTLPAEQAELVERWLAENDGAASSLAGVEASDVLTGALAQIGVGSSSLGAETPQDTDTTKSDEMPSIAGYELLGEIGEGGMGVIYRARDRSLNREVAVKLLHPRFANDFAVVQRFVEEAHITGQLQHPNIPPVHDLGILPNGRPYLAMKLIKGRTLEALLKDRVDPAHDRGRFIAVFEQIAQGVAYAHAHKVLHRDLKPSNVMVGAFGEVQVMDWGLAKVQTAQAEDSELLITDSTRISGIQSEGERTTAGSVLGTPAYMPREQAIGAVDQIDTRSDAFSLGAILCVVLTGQPPYVGGTDEAKRQLAALAKLDDAFARLDACGAEPELVALCKRCLAAERYDRPKDAGAVAKEVAELRAEAERRAQLAEVERARAESQAVEQRKRRKVQLALAAAVLLLCVGGGAFAWWQDRQAAKQEQARLNQERIEVEAKAEAARLEGERKKAEALAEAERGFNAQQARDGIDAALKLSVALRKEYRFKQAEAALLQASKLARSGAPELLTQVEQALRDLDFVVVLDDIRYRKWQYIAEPGGKGGFNTKIASPEYRKAFAQRGLDLTTLDPAEAANRIAAWAIKADLVAAIDDWALYVPGPDRPLHARLLEIARLADPDPWRDRLRDAAVRNNTAAVAKLASEVNPETVSPTTQCILAELMELHGLDPSALLTAARAEHPTDFELAFKLGLWHASNSKDGLEIGSYEAARALRPDNASVWNNLGTALKRTGNLDAAFAAFKKAAELDPNDALARYNIGVVLKQRGDLVGAIAAFNKAIELDSKFAPAFTNLGIVLKDKGKLDEAIAACKKAAELDPKDAQAHNNLGTVLKDAGDVDRAITSFQKAIELDPLLATAHNNLGVVLKDTGNVDGAITAYRKAIEIDPTFALAHNNLGRVLYSKRDLEGARTAFQHAIELDPKDALAHYDLGIVLEDLSDLSGSIAAYRKAIELDPKYAPAHVNLGSLYLDQKKYAEAIVCSRDAIQADPKVSQAHAMLGFALQQTGDLTGARAALTEAVRLDPRWKSMLAKVPPPPAAPPPREAEQP